MAFKVYLYLCRHQRKPRSLERSIFTKEKTQPAAKASVKDMVIQLTLEPTQSPSPKYSRHILGKPKRVEEEVRYSSPSPQVSIDNMLEIHEIISPGEGTSDASIYTLDPAQIVTVSPPSSHLGDSDQEVDDPVLQLQTFADQNLNPSKPPELALDIVQSNASEDPDSVINSILSENCTGNNIDLLDQDELQDFLSCIDASLEELQGMLSQKKLNLDSDVTDELFKPDLSSSDTPVIDTNTSIVDDLTQTPEEIVVLDSDDHMNKDKQLMQYMGNPLLSLFDLPSNHPASSSIDPGAFMTTLEDDLYPYSSSAQSDTAPQNNSELPEDFVGPGELQPIFVLSPVNKLIEEVTDSETAPSRWLFDGGLPLYNALGVQKMAMATRGKLIASGLTSYGGLLKICEKKHAVIKLCQRENKLSLSEYSNAKTNY
ncbi:unnamed protein product [Ranitomeya imitator]|uniref:Vertebrate heat shock transcription factor C-terminal domain-containing protein n=1 Tax=Ranitomeya imitator TaxID=111125 RepID=A0ABN9LLE6_9NEOB|nr:unnamed protein product [Ranitomeya imitator]